MLTEGCHKLLDGACTAAGVQFGAYDHRILTWLAEVGGPEVCAVAAGLITRAHGRAGGAVTLTPARAAVVRQALADAQAWREPVGIGCAECERAGGPCGEHREDLRLFIAYGELDLELGEASS